MNTPHTAIRIGECIYKPNTNSVAGAYHQLGEEWFYGVQNYDRMPPFFMNLVSSTDHWVFIASTGGLSAGRRNAESALFPYYTVDKITENADNTGHIAVLFVTKQEKTYMWEPFSDAYKGLYRVQRNLYKNVYGNTLIFEEVNKDLGMTYRYRWQTSDQYGFVKTATLVNNSTQSCSVQVLDGLRNLLPYGATTALQNGFSNLLNGYKRNELDPETGLGIYTLSSTLTDLAEPSESLKATTVWQIGLPDAQYLLSTQQLDCFKEGKVISQETDIRGRRGAYLVQSTLILNGNTDHEWQFVAEVNQDSGAVVSLINALKGEPNALASQLKADIERCTDDLVTLVANADGLQMTGDKLSANHHFSNVLFNIMRGGIFMDNHLINVADLQEFVLTRNTKILERNSEFFESLPEKIDVTDLLARAAKT
ncbi:MAG: hypothetical protein P1S60_09815, partial [Anaerolineae bacterium]|nr:hypothetical protein [Anaerolineae bacterium]